MLIDMISMDPEMGEEVLHWHPMSYIDHFRHSGFRDRELAIQAYGAADPALIEDFERLCKTLDDKIIHIQSLLRDGQTEAAAGLGKPLYDDISQINGLIVGDTGEYEAVEVWGDDHGVSQSVIDDLFA